MRPQASLLSRRSPRGDHTALALLALSVLGCGADESGRTVADPVAEGLLPTDWLGLAMGIAPPAFVDRGEVTFVAAATIKAQRRTARPPSGELQHIDESELELIDLERGHRYDVTLPAGIEQVAAARAEGLDAQLASLPPEQAEVQSPGGEKVVSGPDTRIAMGLSQGFGADTWLAAIGSLSSGGTATLIGPKVALTAAHVVFAETGETARDLYFYPRVDYSGADWNTVWGAWEVTQVIVPKAYTRNNCHRNHTADCEQYDVAFLRVEPDAEVPGHRWWFSVAALTRAELSAHELKNRGYPSCIDGTPPADCMPDVLYGDQQPCELGSQVPDGDEYAPVVFHSCDTNAGQSGSPMFYYLNEGKPVMVGVHVGGRVNPTPAIPNTFKRFSPNTLTWINGLR